MQCPKCSKTLSMTERSGVEIDYCPACRGIWLDAGELDKIVARSSQLQDAPREERESWWERIFDVFD